MLNLKNDAYYMTEALVEAKKAEKSDETPVGAVVVDKSGKIISRAHNLRETENDATAHAEIIAIRKACKKLNSWRLNDCSIYVTLEPCPMCAGAIMSARIKRLIYGAMDVKLGAVESLFALLAHEKLNHSVNIRAGVLEDECKKILQDFFKVRRKICGR